jgi:hypothetical protein
MTNAIAYATPVDARRLPFNDRRTSILVAGVALLILGALCGCVTALAPVGMFLATLGPRRAAGGATTAPVVFEADVRSAVAAVAVYLSLAVMLVWTGVGAVRLRRWSRPVVIVSAWTWLVSGAIGMLYWLVAAPSLRQTMAASAPPGAAGPPAGVFRAIALGTGVVMALFMLALPAALAWAFQRKGVRETLEFFDPRVRWTDACPTPVLAVSAWLLLSAWGCLTYVIYAVFPLFGVVVSGPLAVAATLAVAAGFVACAWHVYKLRRAGWWAAVGAIVLWAGDLVWTFSRTGPEEFYRRAGYSARQTETILRYGGGYGGGVLVLVCAWAVVAVAYLLFVRGYFWPAAGAAPAEVPAPALPPATARPGGPEATTS